MTIQITCFHNVLNVSRSRIKNAGIKIEKGYAFLSSSLLEICFQPAFDPSCDEREPLITRFTIYGKKVCLLATLYCDGCYWRKKNSTALKNYSRDCVIICLDACLTTLGLNSRATQTCAPFAISYIMTDWYFSCTLHDKSDSPTVRQLQIPHLESWQNHKKYVWQKEVTDEQTQPDTQTEDTGGQNT